MTNNFGHTSSPPAGISGDVIILVVFLFIGGIMFASYAISTPVKTDTPYWTSTSTAGGPTYTPAQTGTATIPLMEAVTLTESVPSTNAIPANVTGTPAVTPTPTPTLTITPVRDCVATDPGSGLPVSDDTWIESAAPMANHSADARLSIRADGGGDQRILIKFDISSLTGSSVATAKLYFYIESTSGATIFLYKPASDWKETKSTWWLAQSENWTTPGGDYDPVPIISTATMAGCRVQLDITALVQDWFTGPNSGVILIASGPSGEISIPSSSAVNGPVLLVTMNKTSLVATHTVTATETGTPTLTPTVTETPKP